MSNLEMKDSVSHEIINLSQKRYDISVVVPVTERYDDLEDFYRKTQKVLEEVSQSVEFIFVVDGDKFKSAFETLVKLKEKLSDIVLLRFKKSFGEATALAAGFDYAHGDMIVTITPYFQVEPDELLKIIHRLQKGCDLVISKRYPRIDSVFNRLQSYVFHWLVRKLTGVKFSDLSCGMRVMRKEVAKELDLYGDLHRFIPLLAWRLGFNVDEVEVRQSERDSGLRIENIGTYTRRILDIMTIFFLFKFTKKPLRFFGLISVGLFFMGFLICLYLSVMKLVDPMPLSNKPMLVLGVLFMILGIQVGSIGLIGEIIIFTHARDLNDYKVKEILE